jgi:CBS-domain-containing membrane protein
MEVNLCMKKEIVKAPVTATVADAASIFCAHHVGMLPVVDDTGTLVGILQLRDLIHIIMPAFVDLIDDIDYVGDFGAMEDYEPAQEELNQPISGIMEEPTCVRDDSGLVRAFAFIYKHELIDLPIVNRDGQLVGLASRVDIGRALLTAWCENASNNQSS